MPKVRDKEMRGGYGRIGEELRGLRSANRQSQNSHGGAKYSIGNGVAKELTHMNKGRGLPEGVGGAGWKQTKGEKSGPL